MRLTSVFCFCFLIPQKNEIIQYLSFYFWLISLNIIPSRSSHAVASDMISHCLWMNNIPLYNVHIYTFKEFIFSHLYFYWTNINKINCNFISFTWQQIFNDLSFNCRIKCIWKKVCLYSNICIHIYVYIFTETHISCDFMINVSFLFFVLFYPFFFLIA